MKLVSSPAIRREAEHYTVDSVYFTSIVFSIQYTVFTIQVELFTIQWTVFNLQVEGLVYS